MPVPTVLVVEDHPAGMLVTSFMIEQLGYAVAQATSGAYAIEKVRKAGMDDYISKPIHPDILAQKLAALAQAAAAV
jgi:CheY-like chemotaxis protein